MVSLSTSVPRVSGRRFYVGMALVFVLIAFGGFIPTYWARIASGTFGGAPVLHFHGFFFFTWTLFFLAQTWMVASGRTMDHRAWGVAGVSLATAMAFTVVLAATPVTFAGVLPAPVSRVGPAWSILPSE